MVSFSHNQFTPFISVLSYIYNSADALLAVRGFHKGARHPVDVRLAPTEAERRQMPLWQVQGA